MKEIIAFINLSVFEGAEELDVITLKENLKKFLEVRQADFITLNLVNNIQDNNIGLEMLLSNIYNLLEDENIHLVTCFSKEDTVCFESKNQGWLLSFNDDNRTIKEKQDSAIIEKYKNKTLDCILHMTNGTDYFLYYKYRFANNILFHEAYKLDNINNTLATNLPSIASRMPNLDGYNECFNIYCTESMKRERKINDES